MKSIQRRDLIVIALALGSLLFGHLGIQSLGVANWPKTQGQVRSCSVEAASNANGEFNRNVRVVYSYTVEGTEYSNEEVAAALVTEKEVPRYKGKYEQGSTVEISYDPKNPQTSQLTSVSKNTYIFLVASLLLGAFTVGMLIAGKKRSLTK